MSSSDHSPLIPEKMKRLCFGEEQPRNTQPSAAAAGKRGRKPGTSRTPKNKVPQRGMGVERLEQMRVQESLQQAAAAGLVVLPPSQPQTPPTLVHHHHHHNSPLGYGAPSPPPHVAYGAYGLDHYPKPMIHAGHSSISTFGVVSHHHQGPNFTTEGVAVAATSPGWSVPNHHQHQLNRVVGPFGSGTPFGGGSPMETSKELSSIPNLLPAARSEPLAFGPDNVFYADTARGSIVWRGRPDSEPWIRVAEDGGYYREEPAELIAVHQNGSSEVMMEYEFLPGKYGRDTSRKELQFATIGSGSAGGEAGSSSIITTVAADYGDTASNALDLSLKLYH